MLSQQFICSEVHHQKHTCDTRQGGTLGLAHLAEMPDEADEKISCLIAMAPVVYAKYLLSPTLVAFSYQANVGCVRQLVTLLATSH